MISSHRYTYIFGSIEPRVFSRRLYSAGVLERLTGPLQKVQQASEADWLGCLSEINRVIHGAGSFCSSKAAELATS